MPVPLVCRSLHDQLLKWRMLGSPTPCVRSSGVGRVDAASDQTCAPVRPVTAASWAPRQLHASPVTSLSGLSHRSIASLTHSLEA
eukprot:367218-Prorocentrum_minimum.AAC.1